MTNDNLKRTFKWYQQWWFIILMFFIIIPTSGLSLIVSIWSIYSRLKPIKAHTEEQAATLEQQTIKSVEVQNPPKKVVKNNKNQFKVAGVSYNNDVGKPIQNELKKLADFFAKKQSLKKYDGLTKREIIEEGMVYEYNHLHTNKVSLIKEPDNPYDSNAIKIMVDNATNVPTHVGYVPKKNNVYIGELMNTGKILRIDAMFTGGKIKEDGYNDHGEEAIIVAETTRGLTVRLYLTD